LGVTDLDIGAAMTQLLRTSEVSDMTGISKDTLRWWRHRGEGPPSFKMGKKIVVYPADSLELWIRNQQVASTKGDQL
jgi:predicted DNA-binding transcriptional regulator AlpA